MTSAELKSSRSSLGMTQAELAVATGYSRRTVEEMEQGRRKVSHRIKIILATLAK